MVPTTSADELDLIIRGGRVVTETSVIQTDVGIQGGKIAAWGHGLVGRQVVDADGMLVLPGGVDPHVHLAMPAGSTRSNDDWATGTLAAAWGGTTTLIDFVEPEPGQSLADALRARREEAEGQAVLDFGLHMTIRWADKRTLDQVPQMVAAGCPSFKAYTTYQGFRLDETEMLKAMRAIASVDGLLMVHCEDDSMIQAAQARLVAAGQTGPSAHPISRPPEAEAAAIRQVIDLSAQAGCRLYIVHISTREGVQAVQAAKAHGLPVTGETCPQYLLLTDTKYAFPGFEPAKFVCSPPLRKAGDADALWDGLSLGSLEVVGTDHCPFNFIGQKDLGVGDFRQIPNGLPGIELRLSLMHTFGVRTGRFGLPDWVRLCATAPAKRFGLHPKKGSLSPGADADVVIFDPERRMIVDASALHENVDYTPYDGLELIGYPRTVIVAGDVLIDDGHFLGRPANGRFISGHLEANSPRTPGMPDGRPTESES